MPWSPAPPFKHDSDGDDFMDSLRISKEIDQHLAETKKAMEKKKKCLQILLLGQSQSGKSSVLKNFQLAFAPKQFEGERLAWRTIIQLNLINSIKFILDVLQQDHEVSDPSGKSPQSRELRRIEISLRPLFSVQKDIIEFISPGNGHRDVAIRPGSNWKNVIKESAYMVHAQGQSPHRRPSKSGPNRELDATSILLASKDDIISLWSDPNVTSILKKRSIRMEETPGFFLNDINRIANPDYMPTDSDVMRARVRTLGVEEHRFTIEKGLGIGSEVYITDLGGSRSQRPRWIPFFQDVQTILFLAPLSFNQALEEDPEINRLEDSLMLWKEICRNRIIANAILILFFNKMDVLSQTLAAGIKVKKYVPSYGSLPNEVAPVTKYFCDRFRVYHRKLSPIPRPFMFHETSAIDTTSMAMLLLGIRETILRTSLQQGEMI